MVFILVAVNITKSSHQSPASIDDKKAIYLNTICHTYKAPTLTITDSRQVVKLFNCKLRSQYGRLHPSFISVIKTVWDSSMEL